jgi:CheY-like chemotaxis protein
LKKYNILSIDDDPNFNNLLQTKIDPNVFTLTTTSTTQSFFRSLSLGNWDLCLVDINLTEGPDAGFQIIRYLRENLKWTQPIIILSHDDNSEKIAHAIECGATDYLTKPLDMPMFNSKVHYLLDEDVEPGTTLKTALVPSTLRECFLTVNYSPYSISEEGIMLVGKDCISKGTIVGIKNTIFNKILEIESIQLMVSKNSKVSKDLYSIFLEYGEDDVEFINKSKSWILKRMVKQP